MKNMLIALILTVMVFQANAQVEDYLNNILSSNEIAGKQTEYIKGYLQPFSTSLGTALGGAMYHRAYTKGFPRFDAGLSMVYVTIPDKGLSFTNPVTNDQEPTFFGKKSGTISGINQSSFALPMLQVNLGLFANLEATARFVTADFSDYGKLTVYGGGFKYGVSELLPLGVLPLDFSVQAGYHKFTLGDILDAGTFNMNFQASVSVPVMPLDVYGGIGFDNSSLVVRTSNLDGGTGLKDVTIDGENKLRYNVGVSLTFLIVNIHADYTISEYNSVAAGIMVVL